MKPSANAPGRSLSAQPTALSPSAATTGPSQNLGDTPGAQPRTSPLAGTFAVHRTGVCGATPRLQASRRATVGGPSGETTHRPTARQGCRRPAPGSLATSKIFEGVIKCHPCRGTLPGRAQQLDSFKRGIFFSGVLSHFAAAGTAALRRVPSILKIQPRRYFTTASVREWTWSFS